MALDCYAILGVTPAAEDVVIRAAYRALMRHYHPDTNPDPGAQSRVREITAAYAVLRDPARRADYDAGRSADVDSWPTEPFPKSAPPMRAAGMASALLALGLVGALWIAPANDQRTGGVRPLAEESNPSMQKHGKPVQLEPEGERLARLAGRHHSAPEIRHAPTANPTPIPAAIETRSSAPLERRQTHIELAVQSQAIVERRTLPLAAKPKPTNFAGESQRAATLEHMSASFFEQSLVHANDAKKELLVAARDRAAAERKSCRSDTCVANAYVRQIRETSVINEGRLESSK